MYVYHAPNAGMNTYKDNKVEYDQDPFGHSGPTTHFVMSSNLKKLVFITSRVKVQFLAS